MNTLATALSRRVAIPRRTPPLRAPRQPVANPISPRLAILQSRPIANQVSGRPGSQSTGHAAQNVKEEVGNTVKEIAKTIAGENLMDGSHGKPEDQSFYSITKALASTVPRPYMVFGLAGALPYLGASMTTVYLAKQAGMAAAGLSVGIDPGVALTILDQALHIQVTYGAVMLSFLGALHWGMEFAGLGGYKGYRRLALGAAPIMFAWPTLALDPTMALVTQWVGFTALWAADQKATTAGWTPKWYSQYRFYLSFLVGTCIIGSLAGTSYWGPVAGHGFAKHDLDRIRSERRKHTKQHENEGVVGGDIETASGEVEGADSYVVLHHKKQEEEGKDEAKSGEEGEDKDKEGEGESEAKAEDSKDGGDNDQKK